MTPDPLALQGGVRRQAPRQLGIVPAEPEPWYFPEWVAGHGARLGLSAADYGASVGVHKKTIYAWEHGRATPMSERMASVGETRGLKEKETWKRQVKSGRSHRAPRFSARWVAGHRPRLGLSAADYAKLVRVSDQLIYKWEKGETRPQPKQLEALTVVLKMRTREAWEKMRF